MPKVDTVLLKVASRCNIDCGYCYVYHSPDQGWHYQPALMSERTIESVVCRLAELQEFQGHALAVVLHGGEPLLLGRPRLDRLLTGLRSALGPASTLALQTNGTLINSEVLDLFADTRTRVSVSLDGPPGVNDRFRVNHRGGSTFADVITGIERLRDHPRSCEFFYGVLAVVDPESNAEQVYSFFKNLRIPTIDFLYRDGNHSRVPYGKHSFESTEYGRWMSRIWDLYVADPALIPIECLDNLVRSLCGRGSTKEGCGETSFGILIVETDGTILKNDTLKNSYDGADRFSSCWSVHDQSFANVTSSQEYLGYVSAQGPTHASCRKCPILRACGGGMVLHRWSDDRRYDNPSVYCHDQQFLIGHILRTLESRFKCA